jgi:cytochrome c7-like protein/class III cytochrome C family protein
MMRLVVAIAIVVGAATAHADVGSVSPGKLARAHAAFETQCDRCHVPFGGIPAVQCLTCHTRLGQRIARGEGYHATVAAKTCISCHGEHRGRDAALSPAPPPQFDHRVALLPLAGKHAQLACERCHPATPGGRRWVGIASTCARCHPDRAHGGSLGGACEKCHRADDWKSPTRTAADHKVSLAGAHGKLACKSCHAAGSHLVAQQSCTSCHAQGHGGTTKTCETCHGVAGWKQVTYAHRPGAAVPAKLPGKHQTAACLGCHQGFRFAGTPFTCSTCHDKQRPHEPLGACEGCHSALSWKTRTFDHERPEIGFALTGKHAAVACEQCHADKRSFKAVAKRTCASCHADVHTGQFGRRTCERCHTTAGWKPSLIVTSRELVPAVQKALGREPSPSVSHDSFGYVLRDGHARAPCASCHKAGAFTQTAQTCSACHADARHRGRFGAACERCHDSKAWSHTPSFDHATTGFALERGHARAACDRCHGRDGMRLATTSAPQACVTCHASPHGRQFGTACTQCHGTGSFREVARFDHARTDFPLELRHATLACSACHDAKQRPVATRACRTCHGDPHRGSNAFDCSDCHRPDRWRIVRFDHDLTAYPLTGRHRIASCGGCHTNPNWTGVRTDCVACHAVDRPRDRLHLTKVTCDDCHSSTTWRTIRAARR